MVEKYLKAGHSAVLHLVHHIVENVEKDAKYLVHTVQFGESTKVDMTVFTLYARKTGHSTDNDFDI